MTMVIFQAGGHSCTTLTYEQYSWVLELTSDQGPGESINVLLEQFLQMLRI